MERIDQWTVHEYLEKLAVPSYPGPASGSAAATIIAMAAALLEMSYKVTVRHGEENIPIALNEIEEIRQQCLDLATEDMVVLTKVIRAVKTRKEFPKEFELAMKNATDPLVSIVKNCEFILKQIEQLIPVCNKLVIAELIGSTYMAGAALETAKLGVEVNLRLLQDENYKDNTQNIIQHAYRNSTEIKERIMNFVNN